MRRISLLLIILYTQTGFAMSDGHWEDSELFQSFAALFNAWQFMRTDLKNQQANLSPTELKDYQAYLDNLQQTLGKQCHQLSTEYESFPALKFGCQPVVRLTEEQIKQQRIAKMNQEFYDDLSKVDEILLREQQDLEQQQNQTGQSGQSGNNASQASVQNGPNDSKNIENQNQQTNQHAFGTETPKPVASKDLPPGTQDDDIVARQLREAAENEASPELKRKLWDEYKRYKASL